MWLELIRKSRDDMYVNDLVTGGESLHKVEKITSDSIELFENRGGGGGVNFTNGTSMNQI